MALEDTNQNLYSPRQFGDVNLVFITLIAGSGQAALDTTRSSNGITVATPGSGVYTITFPCRGKVLSGEQSSVNNGTEKISITGLSISSGVCSLTATITNGDLSGSKEAHLNFLTFPGTA